MSTTLIQNPLPGTFDVPAAGGIGILSPSSSSNIAGLIFLALFAQAPYPLLFTIFFVYVITTTNLKITVSEDTIFHILLVLLTLGLFTLIASVPALYTMMSLVTFSLSLFEGTVFLAAALRALLEGVAWATSGGDPGCMVVMVGMCAFNSLGMCTEVYVDRDGHMALRLLDSCSPAVDSSDNNVETSQLRTQTLSTSYKLVTGAGVTSSGRKGGLRPLLLNSTSCNVNPPASSGRKGGLRPLRLLTSPPITSNNNPAVTAPTRKGGLRPLALVAKHGLDAKPRASKVDIWVVLVTALMYGVAMTSCIMLACLNPLALVDLDAFVEDDSEATSLVPGYLHVPMYEPPVHVDVHEDEALDDDRELEEAERALWADLLSDDSDSDSDSDDSGDDEEMMTVYELDLIALEDAECTPKAKRTYTLSYDEATPTQKSVTAAFAKSKKYAAIEDDDDEMDFECHTSARLRKGEFKWGYPTPPTSPTRDDVFVDGVSGEVEYDPFA